MYFLICMGHHFNCRIRERKSTFTRGRRTENSRIQSIGALFNALVNALLYKKVCSFEIKIYTAIC